MEKYIAAGDFKAHCLQLMDEVAQKRIPLTITKRGQPVVRLMPMPISEKSNLLFGSMAHSVSIKSDIIAPNDEAWDADT